MRVSRAADRSAGILLSTCAAMLLGGTWAAAQTAFGTGSLTSSERKDVDNSAQIALGRNSLREQRYAEAMDQFEKVLKITPRSDEARQGEVDAATAWAIAEIRAQQPAHGMEILERALQQVPDEPELLSDFGIEAIALRQFPIAEEALAAADKLRPQQPKTVYGLARLEIELQRWPDAERELKAYLQLQPGDASAYYGLGHVLAVEQRDDEARTAFERSIQLQPKQTESYFQLGQLDLKAHQDLQAEAFFAKTLERNPGHAGALTGMGEVALRAKDYPKAERYLAEAERSDPNYPTPHYFRGLALAKLGRKDEAEQEMRLGDSRPHATKPAEGNTDEPKPAPTQQPPGS